MVHEIDHTSHRKTAPIAYLSQMSFDFCLPTKATTVPDSPDWLHEVKYDGYRLRLERDGDRVRLITRHGCTAS
jgi:ATP-dependent DNA ligase